MNWELNKKPFCLSSCTDMRSSQHRFEGRKVTGWRRLWDATRANLIFADILWFHLAAVVYRCRSWSEVKAETAWKCFSAWCSYSASDSSSRNTKQCLLSSLKMWACAVVFCFLWFYDGYFCFFPIKVGQIKPGKWHQRVPNYFVDKPLKASEEVVHRHNKFLLLNRCCPLFLKRVFILNALCSCWMFHTFIFQLVGDDSCASYLLVIVIVRIDTLKISCTLICNPSCVFIFLQNTNIWLIFFLN